MNNWTSFLLLKGRDAKLDEEIIEYLNNNWIVEQFNKLSFVKKERDAELDEEIIQ